MFNRLPFFSNRRASIKPAISNPKKTPPSRDALRHAAWYTCERLEQRRLLTTYTGGGVDADGVPQEASYTYLDGNQNTDRIALWGTITAEFIFLHTNPDNTNAIEGAVAPTKANVTAKAGADLFAIYVASASPTASISISQINTSPTSGLPDTPFSAGDGITAINAQTGLPVIADTGGIGTVWLGGRAHVVVGGKLSTNFDNGVPILEVPLETTIGVRPVTADDTLYAGIETAPGVSLNKILIGGAVSGRVDIGGSINTFYAGAIYTGDAGGVLVGNLPTINTSLTTIGTAGGLLTSNTTYNGVGQFGTPQTNALIHNFNVQGDLGNLLSISDIGSNGGVATDEPTYETGFYLSVGGHIGQVKAQDSINGAFYGQNLPTLKGAGTPQTSIDVSGPPVAANSGETFFEGNRLSSANDADSEGSLTLASLLSGEATFVFDEEAGPSLGDSADYTTDSAANAQFLGSLFSSELGHNAIQVEGTLDNSPTIGHDVDYYGVALGANQTITATLTVPYLNLDELDLGIFAPDEGYAPSAPALLASTYSAFGSGARLVNQPITFTSTDAGVYYFAIGYIGDSGFNSTDPYLYGAVNYQLGITGVRNLGIGAIAAVNNIAFPSGTSTNTTTGAIINDPSLTVGYGDLGALISTGGGFIIATNANLTTTTGANSTANYITVNKGNIRVIQAGTVGELDTTTNLFGLAPSIATTGNVGTVRTTSTAGILGLNLDNLLATSNVGAETVNPIGGSYQLLDCAGTFQANIEADGNIGTIRTASLGSANFEPTLQVDANSKSGAGTIDLIDVTGAIAGATFGTLDTGGPHILTGPGGNLRYLHIAPEVPMFNDLFFGGDQDMPITYAAGEAASLIDDSGTRFTITPYRGGTFNGDITAAATTTGTTTTGTATTSVVTGDSITLVTYGIEDKGGVAVVSATINPGTITVGGVLSPVTAPAAVTVDTSANGKSGSVEFGEFDLVGTGPAIAFDTATQKFTTTETNTAESDSALFTGKSRVDVYDFAATSGALAGAGTAALAPVNSVVNNTSGEIANFHALSVETLSANSLGTARSDAGAPVSGATVFVNAFPWHDLRNIIQVGGTMVGDGLTGDPSFDNPGDAITIESTGPLGNILCNGNVENIQPDVGVKKIEGTTGGIVGPVFICYPGRYSAGVPVNTSGNLININIGNGLGTSGSGDNAITGIFADNYIGNVTNQNGSDIRGTIECSGLAGGLTAPVLISPITGLPETNNALHGQYINNISLTDGGSIINADIYTTDSIPQTAQTYLAGYEIADPNTGVNGNPANALYGLGTVSLSGDGGIIGSVFRDGGINSISVAGFGLISSEILTDPSDVVNSIRVAGYGLRSTTISGDNTVQSITAVGNGKELPITEFSKSVRQSESGATTDAYSGQPLDVFDDLDTFLGTSVKHATRKGSTEAGVIANANIVGTFELGSITADRLVGNPNALVTTSAAASTLTEAQYLAELVAETPAMTLSFANSIGTIAIHNNTTNATITTGTLDSFASGGNVVGSTFNVAGEIKNITAGFINGSTHINATGPDGTLDYLATTAGLNANITSSTGIGEILVGTDLGSTNIDSLGNLDELYIKNNMLKGANVIVANKLMNLTIRHNFLGGATIQAKSVTSRTIGGVANGNIILT